MDQHFVGGPAVDAYVVSFLDPKTTEQEARQVVEECGAKLERWMNAIHMAVAYVRCDKKEEVLEKLRGHAKTNNVHSSLTHKKPVPLR